MLVRLAAAAVAALLAFPAGAAERALSAQELDTYAQLRDARALADARAEGPEGKARRTEAEAGFQEALRAAGWSERRYQEVDDLVGEVASRPPGAGAAPPGTPSGGGVEPVAPATVALIRARLPQLAGAAERARRALRQEQEVAVMGRLATVADLQGTWRREREATRAHLAGALHYTDAQVREVLKAQGESTYTFAGDRAEGVESVHGAAGAATAWTASYRLEGRDLVLVRQGQEERLQVGVKGPGELVFGAMGVPTGVYRRR